MKLTSFLLLTLLIARVTSNCNDDCDDNCSCDDCESTNCNSCCNAAPKCVINTNCRSQCRTSSCRKSCKNVDCETKPTPTQSPSTSSSETVIIKEVVKPIATKPAPVQSILSTVNLENTMHNENRIHVPVNVVNTNHISLNTLHNNKVNLTAPKYPATVIPVAPSTPERIIYLQSSCPPPPRPIYYPFPFPIMPNITCPTQLPCPTQPLPQPIVPPTNPQQPCTQANPCPNVQQMPCPYAPQQPYPFPFGNFTNYPFLSKLNGTIITDTELVQNPQLTSPCQLQPNVPWNYPWGNPPCLQNQPTPCNYKPITPCGNFPSPCSQQINFNKPCQTSPCSYPQINCNQQSCGNLQCTQKNCQYQCKTSCNDQTKPCGLSSGCQQSSCQYSRNYVQQNPCFPFTTCNKPTYVPSCNLQIRQQSPCSVAPTPCQTSPCQRGAQIQQSFSNVGYSIQDQNAGLVMHPSANFDTSLQAQYVYPALSNSVQGQSAGFVQPSTNFDASVQGHSTVPVVQSSSTFGNLAQGHSAGAVLHPAPNSVIPVQGENQDSMFLNKLYSSYYTYPNQNEQLVNNPYQVHSYVPNSYDGVQHFYEPKH